LRWSDIELDAGRLFVKRSLTWTRDEGHVGTVPPRFYNPKTKAGYRELPLPAELASMLRTWRLAAPVSSEDLVFGHPTDGGPLRRSFIARKGLWPACSRAGLRRCPLGVFRHSFASNLLSRGVAIPTVAALMGHSSPAITMRVYAHHVKGSDTGAAVAQFASGFLSAAAPVRRARAARHGSHIT
jgi:integrase